MNDAIFIGLVSVDIVLGQTGKFGGVVNFDALLSIIDVALEGRCLLRKLIVELFQARARCVVLVDSGEAKFQ